MRKALSLFYLCTEIITFPLKGRLSSFIVSGKIPYRVKFYTKWKESFLSVMRQQRFQSEQETFPIKKSPVPKHGGIFYFI